MPGAPWTQPAAPISLDLGATMWRSQTPSMRPLPPPGADGFAETRMRRGGLSAPHA